MNMFENQWFGKYRNGKINELLMWYICSALLDSALKIKGGGGVESTGHYLFECIPVLHTTYRLYQAQWSLQWNQQQYDWIAIQSYQENCLDQP